MSRHPLVSRWIVHMALKLTSQITLKFNRRTIVQHLCKDMNYFEFNIKLETNIQNCYNPIRKLYSPSTSCIVCIEAKLYGLGYETFQRIYNPPTSKIGCVKAKLYGLGYDLIQKVHFIFFCISKCIHFLKKLPSSP